MAFSFGASNPTGEPAATFGAAAPTNGGFGAASAQGAPGNGFAFGAAQATTTAAPASASASAGLTGGFSLGWGSSATGASSVTTTTTATSGGYGALAGSTSALSATTPSGTSAGVFAVADFADTFPYLRLLSKIRDLVSKLSLSSKEAQYAAQELLHLLQTTDALANPPPPVFTQPNNAIRQQLQNNPRVTLQNSIAGLTPQMLQEVCTIADALHLSEEHAMALYAEASKPSTRQFLQDSNEDHALLNDVLRASYFLFFQQRLALLKILILLSQSRLEHNLLEATDTLLSRNLIQNLVALVRNLTSLITQVQPQQDQTRQQIPGYYAPMETESTQDKVRWLDHLHQERQMAAECLFYLTYSSQCTAQEIASLIDLIQELTNENLSVLDPVQDVPDAHHPQPLTIPQWGPFTQALPPLREKTNWEWERELVDNVWKMKEPYVLNCVSVLIMAVLCALDTNQSLLNRETHTINEFGVGNALFRSLDPTGSFDGIVPVDQRLQITAVEHWKRKDVWGVLTAAYALALRPVSSVVASPGAQSMANFSTIKRTWKACLTAPSDHKSFTFVRLTLMPALRNTTKKDERCDLHEFLLSVLTEFVSNYLDVVCVSNAIPFSRSKWQDNETERLLIAREEQERNRSFFQSYGGVYEEKHIPTEVDILKRPDCIDDIAAVAVDLCSQGREYAAMFWTSEDFRAEDGSMQTRCTASRALKTLEMLQDKDSSLIPTYVSFLAALAIDQPSLVFDMLNSNEETGVKITMNWKTLFDTLRWYVRKMSDGYAGETKSSTTHETPSVTSNGYYYGVDDYNLAGNKGATSSASTVQPGIVRLEELRETNTAIVLSHLAVITKVASNYARGRTLLATMKLSIEGEATDQEGDSVLVVLFSLAIAPLSPHVRGAVFATLAALLKVEGTNSEEEKLIRDLARKGWDLLELSQVVPVFLLDQYQRKRPDGFSQTMTFPPSSLSLAGSGESNAWLPADPKYGILFEMEHIESRFGCYPSTEGLLQLLTSLVSAAGCPSDLGKASEVNKLGRLRPGCTPFIEYAAYFVVPRALGSRTADDQLPFKTSADSARLVARAFEVIETVLVHYAVPSSISKITLFADELKNQTKLLAAATSLLRLPELAKKLMLTPSENEMNSFVHDFDATRVAVPFSDNTVSLPLVKSPGFTILADILSTTDSELLKALGIVLAKDGGCEGVHMICGKQDFRYGVCWALFGDTPPSVATAKHKHDNGPSLSRQTLLRPLQPPIDISGDPRGSMDVVYWRAKSVAISLRILAAAAVREREFVKALGGVATVIPTLQFKFKTNAIYKKEVHLTSVRDALIQCTSPRYLLSVTQYIASISSGDTEDSEISGAALALLVYCSAESSNNVILSALGAQSISGELRFARAVAERFMISSKRTERRYDADMVQVIFTLLKTDLSYVLLGLPHISIDGVEVPGVASSPHALKQNECFSILLDRLGDDDFVKNPTSSSFASEGFEIVQSLMASIDDSPLGRQRAQHLMARLKARNFWNNCALMFLATRESECPSLLESVSGLRTGRLSEGADVVLHAAAWFIDALAIHCTKKIHQFSQDSLSSQNQRLLSNLFDKEYHLLVNALDCVPLRSETRIFAFPQSLLPFQHLVESCMYQMTGSHDHVAGHLLVNVDDLKKKLSHADADGSGTEVLAQGVWWADNWNEYVRRDCAAAHLSSAIVSLIESALDFSMWTIKSGISSALQSSNDLSSSRNLSLLILLDRMVDRLIDEGGERVSSMSSRLLKSASINLCTEVLLLVDRMTITTQDRSCFAHFAHRLGLAAMSSLDKQGSDALSTVEEDERSILLGSALLQLLDTGIVEVQQNTRDIICAVSVSFGDLSCRSVSVNTTDRRDAKVTIAARSILASLIGHLENFGTTATNPVIDRLATTGSSSSTSSTILEAIVQLIPTLDDNVCMLIEKMACSEGGTHAVINSGVMDALVAAGNTFNKMQSTPWFRENGHDSFFASNLSLLRTLLASSTLSDHERDVLRRKSRVLLVSYSSLIVRVCEAFPTLGDTWLEIVQTLALAMPGDGNYVNQVSFATAKSGMCDPASALSEGLEQIIGHIVASTMTLLEHPFPNRFLVALPPKLRVVLPGPTWWDTLEQQQAAKATGGDMMLPNPPTGLTFGWSTPVADELAENSKTWTPEKYDACLAGAQVVDASLTLLVGRVDDEGAAVLDVNVGSLARGICRYTDSWRAMSQRIHDIDDVVSKAKVNGMGIGAFDDKSMEMMMTERSYLQEIFPIFDRCREKGLVLAYKLFKKMEKTNEESHRGLPSTPSQNMKHFAELVLLALQHSRLDLMGASMGANDEFSMTIAKTLLDALVKVQS